MAAILSPTHVYIWYSRCISGGPPLVYIRSRPWNILVCSTWYICSIRRCIISYICTSYRVPGSMLVPGVWLHPRPSSWGPRGSDQNNDNDWGYQSSIYNNCSTSNVSVEQHRETMLRPCRTTPCISLKKMKNVLCNSGTTFIRDGRYFEVAQTITDITRNYGETAFWKTYS